MTASSMTRDAMTETFNDTDRRIESQCRNFARSYKMDFEECLLIAWEAFCEAFASFDRSMGCVFSTHAYNRIHSRLLDAKRLALHRHVYCPRVDYDISAHEHTTTGWKLIDFLDELSDDAKTVVKLSLHPPIDVEHSVLQRGNGGSRNVKAALREFLLDLGWSAPRVSETFKEIAAALSND